MRTFQEQLAKDIDDVFFNAPAFEFVTTHKIADIKDGKVSAAKEFQVIVDHELFNERRISSKAENITMNGLIFFIKKSDWLVNFKRLPRVRKYVLRFDGKLYNVDEIRDNGFGTLEIMLEATRG